MSENNLLPCPWAVPGEDHTLMVLERTCGRDDEYNPRDRAFPLVVCMCGAQVAGKDWTGPETAVAAWNRRAVVPSTVDDPDALAAEIRRVDGNHSLGAGALAEALMPFLSRRHVLTGEMSEVVRDTLIVMRDNARTATERNMAEGAIAALSSITAMKRGEGR